MVGGVLRQVSESGGDSGWLASKFGQRYGRWEARVRSQATSANSVRKCIRCAPSTHQTIQLDNFHGSTMQSAVHEVDWTGSYSLTG